MDDKPDELYGTITVEGKFIPTKKNDKIVVKGRSKQEKSVDELEAELDG